MGRRSSQPGLCGLKSYLKAVICLVVLIVFLQGFHMIVLMRIQDAQHSFSPAQPLSTQSARSVSRQGVVSHVQEVVRRAGSSSIMDSSGMYMIVPNIAVPAGDWPGNHNQSQVAICTQTTYNHLHYLHELSSSWQGPISVTVFTHGVEAPLAIYAITMLHHCSKTVRKHGQFHLAYPIAKPIMRLKSILKKNFNCDNFLDRLRNTSAQNYASSDWLYPVNILRNIAIQYTDSSYILMIDIDLMPSSGLQAQFQHYLKRHPPSLDTEKTTKNQSKAYVIPAFESKSSNFKSLTKHELIQEWDKENIRPFYYKSCLKCQRVTDYDRWRKLPAVDFLEVGYQVEWEDPWEPFYIASKSDLPLYDGRFKQYGFNRISQVCEMHIAGFQFAVMNTAFVVHDGFKEPGQFHDRKQEENNKNVELFRQFKDDLKYRYTDSKLEC